MMYLTLMLMNPTYGPLKAVRARREENSAILKELMVLDSRL